MSIRSNKLSTKILLVTGIFYILSTFTFCLHIETKDHSSQSHEKQFQIQQKEYNNHIVMRITSTTMMHKFNRLSQILFKDIHRNQPEQNIFLIKKQYQCQNDPNYNYVIIDLPQNSQSDQINAEFKYDHHSQNKKEVVIMCGVWANSLLATEVCLQFIENVVKSQYVSQINKNLNNSNNYYLKISNQNTFYLTQFLPQVDQILKKQAKITVFYRANDQRDKVVTGKDYCLFTNSNNVNVQLNFPTGFNHFGWDKESNLYPGQQPLSQPFSKCLDNYLSKMSQTQNKIHTFVDLYTVYFKLWDSFESQNNRTYPLLKKLKQKYCQKCSIDSYDSQNINGNIFTDIKKRYKAQHSVMFLIYQGPYNNYNDEQSNCMAENNPLTQESVDYYKKLWTDALKQFIAETVKVQSQ